MLESTQRNLLYNGKYRISSARIGNHTYDCGAYFITICTKDRKCYLGDIQKNYHGENEIKLSAMGRFCDEQIRNITDHCPYAEIPLWVIMPNHIHMIIVIDHEKTPHDKRVSAVGCSSVMDYATQMQTWLSVIVRLLKSSVTHFAKENKYEFSWQSRYHDHIIRGQESLNRIADYIEHNVQKWDMDCYRQ